MHLLINKMLCAETKQTNLSLQVLNMLLLKENCKPICSYLQTLSWSWVVGRKVKVLGNIEKNEIERHDTAPYNSEILRNSHLSISYKSAHLISENRVVTQKNTDNNGQRYRTSSICRGNEITKTKAQKRNDCEWLL